MRVVKAGALLFIIHFYAQPVTIRKKGSKGTCCLEPEAAGTEPKRRRAEMNKRTGAAVCLVLVVPIIPSPDPQKAERAKVKALL